MSRISPIQTDPEIMRELGDRLRTIRKARRLKLQVAAAQAGLSRRTIYRAEIGDNPTLETLLRLFRLYGCLGELDLLVKPPEISPMELLHAAQSKSRRVSLTKQEGPKRPAGSARRKPER